MPPTIGGISIPYDSGQSGTARPEPVDVTIAPAKMRNSVDAATNFVKRRSQTGVGVEPPSRIAASSLRLLSGNGVIGGRLYTSWLRRPSAGLHLGRCCRR